MKVKEMGVAGLAENASAPFKERLIALVLDIMETVVLRILYVLFWSVPGVLGDKLGRASMEAQGQTKERLLDLTDLTSERLRDLLTGVMPNAWMSAIVAMVLLGLLWWLIVRIYRPASPADVLKFRRYWFVLFAVSMGAVIAAQYSAKLYHSTFFEGSSTAIVTLIVLNGATSLLVFWSTSVAFSPPTVISAVPGGALFSRLRWR